MIHNPLTVAMGDSEEMRKAIQLLDEVKESILNAYEIKTGMSRARLSHLMDGETWMNAKKALELGFCDEIAFQPESDAEAPENSFSFSRRVVTNCLMDKLRARMPEHTDSHDAEPPKPEAPHFPVSDDDPKMQLIRYQLLWEGFPHD